MPAHPPDPGKDPVGALLYAYRTLVDDGHMVNVNDEDPSVLEIVVSSPVYPHPRVSLMRRQIVGGVEATAREMLLDLGRRTALVVNALTMPL